MNDKQHKRKELKENEVVQNFDTEEPGREHSIELQRRVTKSRNVSTY